MQQKTNLESTGLQSAVAHTQASNRFHQPGFSSKYIANMSDLRNPQGGKNAEKQNLESEHSLSLSLNRVMEHLKESPLIQNSETKYESIKNSIQLMTLNWQNSQLQNMQMLGEIRGMYNNLILLQGQQANYFSPQMPPPYIGFRPQQPGFQDSYQSIR